MVWSDGRENSLDIWGYDLKTGRESCITRDSVLQMAPIIYDDYVVGQELNGTETQISGCNLSTGEYIRITRGPGDKW